MTKLSSKWRNYSPCASWIALLILVLLPACSRKEKANGISPAKLASSGMAERTQNSASPKENKAAGPATEFKAPDQESPFYLGEFQPKYPENPGYVGYQACAECHAERVAECEPTAHFQTCRVPTAERMPSAFRSKDKRDRTLSLPGTDVTFEMSMRDGKFIQLAGRATNEQPFESTIDLVYGAGQESDEVYLSWHADDSMWELPVAWVYARDCWGAAGFDRVGGTNFSRHLTVRCFECHNTWFAHEPGTLSTYRRKDLLLGVTCERCHGPGQDHVAFHQVNPKETNAQHILYPGGLPRERLLEVCTQCHSNAIRHKGPALSYRPGEPLADHYRAVSPKFQEDDHVVDQVSDLKQSRCFQQSTMTCVTCHDPHLTSQASHGMTFTETCTQCHQPDACKARPDIPTSVADNCVECHMREYQKINVNFDLADDSYFPPPRRWDHHIAVNPAGTKEVLLKHYRSVAEPAAEQQANQLEQDLLAHWFKDASSRKSEGRFTAAISSIREALKISPESAEAKSQLEQLIQKQRELDDLQSRAEHAMRERDFTEAFNLFSQVTKIRPDSAIAFGRMGALKAELGDRDKAKELLKHSVSLDADEQYGLTMLAWLELNEGNFAKAAKLYERANQVLPFDGKINFLWAQSLIQMQQFDKAQQCLQTAVTSDPKNIDALRALAGLCLHLGQPAKGLDAAEDAVRLSGHADPGDLMVLAETYLALGNTKRVTQTTALAIQLAKQRAPEMVAEIEAWKRQHRVGP